MRAAYVRSLRWGTQTMLARIAWIAAGMTWALAVGCQPPPPEVPGPEAWDPESPHIRASFGWDLGEMLPNVTYLNTDGNYHKIGDWSGHKATVLVARDIDCPISRKYGPRIAALEAQYKQRGVQFVYLNVNPAANRASIIEEEIERHGFQGEYIHDPDGRLIGRRLRLRSTAEVFVVDGSLTIQYRGGIDDQYEVGFTRETQSRDNLVEALEDVLAERRVRAPETAAPGCLLGFESRREVARQRRVTYHNRVSRILQQNCVSCHRPGGVGPIALDDYENARFYRFMMMHVIDEGLMPPWRASPKFGKWTNEMQLSMQELEDLFTWAQSGAPEGDPADAPRPMTFEPGWRIGKPDAVFELQEAFTVPAEGVVDYLYTYVKTNFKEDRWVKAMEIRPTAPAVVHHVTVFVESPELMKALDAGESIVPQTGIDGYFAVTVPGFESNEYPEGSAKLLPAGGWLKFQMHYTPNGTEAVDQTQIGMIFADEPPMATVRTGAAVGRRFRIPPHASNHRVSGDYTFERDGSLLALFPHMHLRGKAFRYELIRPGSEPEVLLEIPEYDFNWQMAYHFKRLPSVTAGTVLRATGWFDNSEGNPLNPDPTAEVRFGEQTEDEMMIGYFDWVTDDVPTFGATDSGASTRAAR